MEGNYITWNMVNWITVVLMVTIGLAVSAAVVSVVRQHMPGNV